MQRGTEATIDASTTLAAEPESAAEARRFTVDVLRQWGVADLIDTATLLVSELVTNAVLHARSKIVVRVDVDGHRLRVEVRDDTANTPQVRPYGAHATTGRGLLLVETLATRWGFKPQGAGKAVWFELEREHANA